MSRTIVLRLLYEFILARPGRPFEEVEKYAEELGATSDELRESILFVVENLVTAQSSITGDSITPQEKEKTIPFSSFFQKIRFLEQPKIILLLLFVVIAETLILNVKRYNNVSNPNNSSQTLSTTNTNKNVPGRILPKVVFANQAAVDPKKVFSLPPSGITLKFTGVPKKEVLGFFPYWMLDMADQIDLGGLTMLALFGLEPDAHGNIITEPDPGWSMWQDARLEDLIRRAKERRIKVFLTIKSFDNKTIEEIVSSDVRQRRLIANIIALINQRSLDGINIDFEYTGQARAEVVSSFTRFVANLGAELKRQLPDAFLTLDTYLKSGGDLSFFDVEVLENHIDAFVVMGYDIHTPNGSPGPVAPMEGENGIIGFMQSYLERISPKKLILGVPYYGYDWEISEDGSNNPAQILSFAEVAANSGSAKILWDEVAQSPYYLYQDAEGKKPRIVYFDNARSIGIKYDYVNRKNLKGVALWALGYDGRNVELENLLFEKFAR